MSKEKILHDYFSSLGRKSVKARMKKTTPEERSRIASEAAKARWSRSKATTSGRKKGK
jgi:hypothetical protein